MGASSRGGRTGAAPPSRGSPQEASSVPTSPQAIHATTPLSQEMDARAKGLPKAPPPGHQQVPATFKAPPRAGPALAEAAAGRLPSSSVPPCPPPGLFDETSTGDLREIRDLILEANSPAALQPGSSPSALHLYQQALLRFEGLDQADPLVVAAQHNLQQLRDAVAVLRSVNQERPEQPQAPSPTPLDPEAVADERAAMFDPSTEATSPALTVPGADEPEATSRLTTLRPLFLNLARP